MDRSSRSQSPTRSRSPVASKPAVVQRGASTASGMAAREGGTGNALLDHSLRIDGTRRTDNVRQRGINSNTNKPDSPTTTTAKQDNRSGSFDHSLWTAGNSRKGNKDKDNDNNTFTASNTTNNANNGGLRRRAYSWRGEHPPPPPLTDGKLKGDLEEKSLLQQPLEYIPMMSREARSVVAWVVIAALLQLLVALLTQLASYHPPRQFLDENNSYWILRTARMVPSLLAGMILELIPTRVFSQTSPGLIYASAWLLIGIRETFGCIPHIPSRICAGVLGRLSWMECALAVTVQMTCTVSTVLILQYCFLPEQWAKLALKPLEYTTRATSGEGNPFIVDFIHELIVNTLFTVGLQVLPVLLSLNRASRWWTMLFLYPLYVYAVDGSGKGSTLSPSIVFALSYTHSVPCQLVRCIAQLLSGLMAGRLMMCYFPDENPKTA